MDIINIRQEIPILSKKIYGRPLIYFDNAATLQVSHFVLNAIEHHYTSSHANIHRGIHYLSEISTREVEKTREKVRAFIGAQETAEIVFTSGTTAAINIIARAYADSVLKLGDNVIVSEMEHHSNFIPWQQACKRTGADFIVLPFDDKGDLSVATLDTMIDQNTKIVCIAAVSNVLGTVNPIRDLIKVAHAHRVPILIDAAQGMRHSRFDVMKLDCDYLCFSGHKLGGGTGSGILYGKREHLEKLPPVIFGGGMVNQVSDKEITFDEIPFKFEAGTQDIASIIALGAAIDYIVGLGIERIATYESDLLHEIETGIKCIENINILGHPKQRAGVLSFNVDGIHFFDIACLLDKLGVAVRSGHHCARPLLNHYGLDGVVRVSPSFYNTHEEVAAFLDALALVIKTIRRNGNMSRN